MTTTRESLVEFAGRDQTQSHYISASQPAPLWLLAANPKAKLILASETLSRHSIKHEKENVHFA